MADGFSFLFILSTAMFFGSYLAGYVPLLFNLSESRMRVVSVFGAGLLIGTALSVIIPEGVEALYSANKEVLVPSHTHSSHEGAPHDSPHIEETNNMLNGAGVKEPDSPRIIPKDAHLNNGINAGGVEETGGGGRSKRDDGMHAASDPHARRLLEQHEHGHSHSHGGNMHSQIGYSLVFGFIFMLLVDQISSSASRNDRSGRSRLSISATVGLVVHAAADGIALGSASTINKSDVQLIVFVAIMLHKAPAAFGLVSFLLMEGLDKGRVRRHLLVFSAAAPAGAVATFALINSWGSDLSSESSTGVLMLFSAGTFLYVSTVHVLPELAKGSRGTHELLVDVQAPSSAGHSHSAAVFSLKELLSIIGGAVVPAIIASGHSH